MSQAPGVRLATLTVFGLGWLALAALLTTGCGGGDSDGNDGSSGPMAGISFEMHHDPG